MPKKTQSAEHIVDRMSRADLETLALSVFEWVDGKEWDSDTIEGVAHLFSNAGFTIREPGE